jgi:hypothetical protein
VFYAIARVSLRLAQNSGIPVQMHVFCLQW